MYMLVFVVVCSLGSQDHTCSSVEVSSADGAVGLEDFVVVREGDLSLVAAFLVAPPGLLTIALLLSHPFVLLLHLLGVGCLTRGVFVLEHASHAEDGLLLGSPVGLFLALSLGSGHVFSVLLVRPVALVLCIQSHAIVVH